MRYSHFRRCYVVILVSIVALTLLFSGGSIAKEGKSSLSGQVVDMDRKPIAGLELAIIVTIRIKETFFVFCNRLCLLWHIQQIYANAF